MYTGKQVHKETGTKEHGYHTYVVVCVDPCLLNTETP